MNCWARHSPPDTGGVDATSRRSREASFNGADGVVQNGTSPKECIPKQFVNPSTPSAPLRRLRNILLMPQPPLLYQEGNSQPDTHSHLHRRAYSRFAITWTRSAFKEGMSSLLRSASSTRLR